MNCIMDEIKNDLMLTENDIKCKIFTIRGLQVMIDRNLAELYNIENRALKQAVKRNINRFPLDFMFVLTENETKIMVSQNVIPSKSYFGGAAPFCFTEQGVTMLSCILNSKIAIEVNIRIIRVFVKMREYALTHKEIFMQLAKLEKEVSSNNRDTEKNSKDIENVFAVLKELIEKQRKPVTRNRIGFKHYD